MQDERIISEVIRILQKRRSVLLSEVISSHIPSSTKQKQPSYSIDYLRNTLEEKGFIVSVLGKDIEITRKTRDEPLLLALNPAEKKRLDSYLNNPALPGPLETIIEQYIEKKTGKQIDDPVLLERLRRAIQAQKGEYWKEGMTKKVHYEQGYNVFAYLAYQFPVYFIQFEHILARLVKARRFPGNARILDIGSGPGAAALATMDFLCRFSKGNATLYALERSAEQREAYSFLTTRFASLTHCRDFLEPLDGDLMTVQPGMLPRDLDLIVIQNVFNELTTASLAEKASRIMDLSGLLSETGMMLITEPADMENSVSLRMLAGLAEKKGMHVNAPCRPGWMKTCNPSRCWSFIEHPALVPTALMKRLSGVTEAYRYSNVDLKYSFVFLSPGNPVSTEGGSADFRRKYSPLSSVSRNVGKRINTRAAVMSCDLGNRETHLWKICDGSPQKPVYAVMPAYHSSPSNHSLGKADYGEIVEIHGALVRYNSRYDSYNLLITRNTDVILPVHGTRSSRKSRSKNP